MKQKSLYLINLLLIVACVLMCCSQLRCNERDFEKDWLEMQNVLTVMAQTNKDHVVSDYYHTYWLETRNHIKKVLESPANKNIFLDPIIQNAMVRQQRSVMQHYEILYLTNCISSKTKESIDRFSETSFTNLPWEISEFNCTTNSLGHLYYAARLLEGNKHVAPHKILEFGSGFGNLARVLALVNPESTILLIDFPELLALQYLYLNSTLADAEIVVHSSIPETFKEGAIHLVPVFLIKDLSWDADAFISTFALSESTTYLQNLVIEKKFFNASLCYLSGQLRGWNSLHFVHHSLLFDGVSALYKDVLCEPFHTLSTQFINDLPSYELLARNV